MEDQSEKPAFPCVISEHDGSIGVSDSGLTKREYFAGLAMQGLLANSKHVGRSEYNVAVESISYADALLAALETEPKP